MTKTRALLRYGLWPATSTPVREPTELTSAARLQGERAIEELNRLGVTITIDAFGKTRFCGLRAMSFTARRIVERLGDVIEATLIERARSGSMNL